MSFNSANSIISTDRFEQHFEGIAQAIGTIVKYADDVSGNIEALNQNFFRGEVLRLLQRCNINCLEKSLDEQSIATANQMAIIFSNVQSIRARIQSTQQEKFQFLFQKYKSAYLLKKQYHLFVYKKVPLLYTAISCHAYFFSLGVNGRLKKYKI